MYGSSSDKILLDNKETNNKYKKFLRTFNIGLLYHLDNNKNSVIVLKYMKKFNYIASAKRTFRIESDAIKSLSTQLDKNFEYLCDEIRASDGKFIIMGVGKSGHIGQKISATLSSTGTGSVFIHPTEAAHGDMGLIEKKDIVLLISNSGETDEIINIIPSLKRLSYKISSLTGKKGSTISKSADISIVLNTKNEACPLGQG